MNISWFSKGCFLIKSKSNKTQVLLEPFQEKIENVDLEKVGFVTLASDKVKFDHSLIFDWPGEYETKGIGVKGINIKKENGEESIVFILVIGKKRICHLGEIDRVLTTEELTLLGDIDILLLPVGGNSVIDAKNAHKIADEIEPRMIIPMYYSVDGEEGFAPLDEFRREMGIKEEMELRDSVEINTLPSEDTEIVLLNKS